ncbi:pilus assembly protein [Aliiroseovarius sp. M344]|uniref:TadE/TadG family type IV pilus assembly protein n=1 Tax=Aliiroseovarius sp. M344 TaxID=2867010 RepID=UPI0021ADA9CD|nr:pilus assembly protein [Aliiroseovarius sp. M344]UWQ15623.1 pilus assembly protein [Aliiroseovarius sp. M344]
MLTQKLRSFARVETGTVTVESVIILPVLFFAVMALFTYFDAYRKQSLALKANYAVADFLSRNYRYDQQTLEGLDELFEYMSKTGESSWVRVTAVECPATNTLAQCNDEVPRKLEFKDDNDRNSNASANSGISGHTEETMRQFLGPVIPKMYVGESLFVVETVAKYKPMFPGRWTGIYSRDFEHVVVTGSREYDDLCYDEPVDSCPTPVTD